MDMEKSLAFSFSDKEFTEFLPEDYVTQLYTRWADFNIHDPGVTTYEALQFAFEDLTYRYDLSIQILLQGRYHNAFSEWSVRDLRPFYAVTVNDYRRVMARMNDVINGMVYPCDKPNVAQGSLLPTSLLTVEAAMTSSPLSSGNDIKLVEFRALGEYFNRRKGNKYFVGSNMQQVDVRADVTFNFREDSIVNKRLLERAVQEFLLPALRPIDFRYVDDMQALIESEYLGPDKITEAMEVISPASINKECYRKQIVVSELYEVLEGLSFLKSVNSIEIALASKGRYTGTALELGRYCFTPLDNLVVNGEDLTKTDNVWDYSCDDTILNNMENPLNELRFHNLGKFYSIQESFPSNYGIGRFLSDKTSSELNESSSFRGYLYFMDQIRANVLAQMGNFPRIFSTDDSLCDIARHPLADYPFYEDLDISTSGWCESGSENNDNCNDMHIQPTFCERRLNYLLALNGWSTEKEIPTQTKNKTLLEIKQSFLDLVHDPCKSTRGINKELNFIFRSKSLAMLQEMIRVVMQTEVDDVRVLEHVFLQPVLDEEQAEKMDFDLTVFLFTGNRGLQSNEELMIFIDGLIRDFVPLHIRYNLVWCDKSALIFDTMLNTAFPPDSVFYFDNPLTINQQKAMVWLKGECGLT